MSIEEAREILGEKFNHISDEHIQLLINLYTGVANIIINKAIEEKKLGKSN